VSVLCNWRGYWALCARVDIAKDSCFISGGPWLPSEEEHPTLSRRGKKSVYGTVSPLADVVFYPRLSYHGLNIASPRFYIGDDQPRVICSVSPSNLSDLQSEYFLEIQQRHPTPNPGEVLRQDGWAQPDKGVYEKIVHVDNLEKIEGPPPDDVCFPPELRDRIRATIMRRGRWWTEPLASPTSVDQQGSPLIAELARADRLYFVGEIGRPHSPRIGIAECMGVALLFTDKEHAMLDALAHGPKHQTDEIALIAMTPDEAAKYLRDLQQVSAERGHPITKVVVDRGCSGYMTEIDDLCASIETRGGTTR
jgi:hypothetical protein